MPVLSTETDWENPASSRVTYGVLLMIVGLALYPSSDAIIKHLSSHYSVIQTTFLRAFTRLIPLLVALALRTEPLKVFKTTRFPLHAIRLFVNFIFTYTFMYAYSLQSLTDVCALSYTSSLFMLGLSALLLKESVSFSKWCAVLIGMIGVGLAANFGQNSFKWISLVILFGTFLGALNKILMKKLSETEHSLSITIYPNIIMILFSLPFLIGFWEPMTFVHWLLFLLVGLIAAGGQYAIAQSLKFAPASILAPLEYSTFIWSLLFDYLWWKSIPKASTLVGAFLIICTNLYIFHSARKEDLLLKNHIP